MPDSIHYDRRIFAENLLRLMRENEERQVDVARLLSVSKSTVSSYCSAQQLPRMDKIEQLAHHYGVSRSALLGAPQEGAPSPALPRPLTELWLTLNEKGQAELLRYGGYLRRQTAYLASAEAAAPVETIRLVLDPAALCSPAPREGTDFQLIPRPEDCPAAAEFCLRLPDDSMEPFLPAGSLVFLRRETDLRDYDAGLFLVGDQVLCRQWCSGYNGSAYLLPANPLWRDRVLEIPPERPCLCLGKLLLKARLPQPPA